MHKIGIITGLALLFSVASCGQNQIQSKKQQKMQVTVWDTYVKRSDGRIMHFDIIAPETTKDPAIIHKYGNEYLKLKGESNQSLTAAECRRCHVREIQAKWEEDINRQGYYILEMENCD